VWFSNDRIWPVAQGLDGRVYCNREVGTFHWHWLSRPLHLFSQFISMHSMAASRPSSPAMNFTGWSRSGICPFFFAILRSFYRRAFLSPYGDRGRSHLLRPGVKQTAAIGAVSPPRSQPIVYRAEAVRVVLWQKIWIRIARIRKSVPRNAGQILTRAPFWHHAGSHARIPHQNLPGIIGRSFCFFQCTYYQQTWRQPFEITQRQNNTSFASLKLGIP